MSSVHLWGEVYYIRRYLPHKVRFLFYTTRTCERVVGPGGYDRGCSSYRGGTIQQTVCVPNDKMLAAFRANATPGTAAPAVLSHHELGSEDGRPSSHQDSPRQAHGRERSQHGEPNRFQASVVLVEEAHRIVRGCACCPGASAQQTSHEPAAHDDARWLTRVDESQQDAPEIGTKNRGAPVTKVHRKNEVYPCLVTDFIWTRRVFFVCGSWQLEIFDSISHSRDS